MQHDVFISYSNVDRLIAEAVCTALETAGVRCWIAPRDIQPGSEWGQAIIDAIDRVHAMVLVFSLNANDSVQVRREVERAASRRIDILPIRFETHEPSGAMAYFLAGLQWFDALTPPFEHHLQRVAGSAKALVTSAAARLTPENAEPRKNREPITNRGYNTGISYDLVSPNITAIRAFDETMQDCSKTDYELLDVIGSYYICLKTPDFFFHRFPEWLFVFRRKDSPNLTEVRVQDSRLPRPLALDARNSRSAHDGGVLMHMKFKVPLASLGAEDVPIHEKDVLADLDPRSRAHTISFGTGPADDLVEVIEAPSTRILVRARPVGRPTDNCVKYNVHENFSELGKIKICNADFPSDDFYRSLSPIQDWTIDVYDAIEKAREFGALATPAGKFGHAGGPGSFRLFSGEHRNLRGPYWQLPFRVGFRPLLVDARSGDVFAVDNAGNFSLHW